MANAEEEKSPSKVREHVEKIFYLIVGALLALGGNFAKDRVFVVPDLGIEASICAPVVAVTAELVNVDTGKRYPVENPGFPNPVEISFRNVGKKQLENVEIVLEFGAKGAVELQNEAYATVPPVGFGSIEVSKEGEAKRRIKVALFNPREEIKYHVDAVRPTTVVAYSKSPGLSFYQLQRPGCRRW